MRNHRNLDNILRISICMHGIQERFYLSESVYHGLLIIATIILLSCIFEITFHDIKKKKPTTFCDRLLQNSLNGITFFQSLLKTAFPTSILQTLHRLEYKGTSQNTDSQLPRLENSFQKLPDKSPNKTVSLQW